MTEPTPEQIAQSKAPHARCWECPLAENKCVPTTGPVEGSPVAFVSRSPGKHDVRNGRPFTGPSGKVLDHLLNKYGVEREQIITTNVVLCQTDDPPTEAIKACNPRLEAEIADCGLIIAGGAEAVNALTHYRALYKARGFQIYRHSPVSGKKQRAVATNNPAMVIRNSDSYPDMVADFKRALKPMPPPSFPKVEVITDDGRIGDVLRSWLKTKFDDPIASDLEWHGKRIECAGFSRNASKAITLAGAGLRTRTNLELLQQFYSRTDIRFIWHNGKSDTKVLRLNGIEGRVDEDTYLLSYALDERPGYHSLEYLLSSEFGWPDYEPQSVKNFKKTGELPDAKSARELYTYNGYDTAGTLQLYDLLSSRIIDEGDLVVALYRKRLLRAAATFRTVELNGFHYDVEEACNLNEREAIPRLMELEEKLQQITGHPLYNPRSPKQTAAIIYGEWGLKHNLRDMGKRKLSRSTGKEVREEIAAGRFTSKPHHRGRIVEFAQEHGHHVKITRIKGNYIEGLIKRTKRDGKVYCNFNIANTVTGRASSNDPNLQNVMREGYEDIPGIRTLFLPSPGNVLVAADYSQAELRTCAKLSGDKKLLEIYRDSSRSLHKERAAAFYGPNYTYEEYVKSKNINFGVTYGQSAAAFAQMYHMPEDEAQAYIDSWWGEFPQLKKWTVESGNRGIQEGYVQSPFGHKRRFHLITNENIGDIRREIVNFTPQNVAAWLTILSVCDLVDSGVRVIATVHDSIVADVPSEQVDRVAAQMTEIMAEQPIKELGWKENDIPFLCDISTGNNWGELKGYEFLPEQEEELAA